MLYSVATNACVSGGHHVENVRPARRIEGTNIKTRIAALLDYRGK